MVQRSITDPVYDTSAGVARISRLNSQSIAGSGMVYLSSDRHLVRGSRSVDPSHVIRIALERERRQRRLALFNGRSGDGDTFPRGSPHTNALTARSCITGSLEISRAVCISIYVFLLLDRRCADQRGATARGRERGHGESRDTSVRGGGRRVNGAIARDGTLYTAATATTARRGGAARSPSPARDPQ